MLVCNNIVEDLKGFLLSDSVRTEMMTWSDSEVPDMVENDIQVTHKIGNNMLRLF